MVKRYDPVISGDFKEVVDGPFVDYSDYAALQAENERLKANTAVTVGVGDGGGTAFVHGDYDSIKLLQGKLLELERLRAEVKVKEEKLVFAMRTLNDVEQELLALIDAHKEG